MTADERAVHPKPTYGYNLTPRGVLQAKTTGEYLKKEFGDFDHYYTSYYNRARETLGHMYTNASVIEDVRLAEAQRGIYHTMTKSEIADRFPEELARKDREDLYHYRPFGGENWPDVELRCHSFLDTLYRECSDEDKVLVVAHGQLQIMMQKILDRFSIKEALDRYDSDAPANAGVTVYSHEAVNGKSKLVLAVDNFIPWQKNERSNDRSSPFAP